MNARTDMRCAAVVALVVAGIAFAGTAFAQDGGAAAAVRAQPAGTRYFAVTSRNNAGLAEVDRQLQQAGTVSPRYVDGLRQENTAILELRAGASREQVLADWNARFGNRFDVVALPDHYGRLFAPTAQVLVDDAQIAAARKIRSALPAAKMRAVTLPPSAAVANYMVRKDASSTGDLAPESSLQNDRPAMVVPVDGVQYRIRADTFDGEQKLLTGAVEDSAGNIVGYARMDLANEQPEVRFSVGSNDFAVLPVGETEAASLTAPVGLLVETSTEAMPDHDGSGPSVADIDGAPVDATSVTGDQPAASDVPAVDAAASPSASGDEPAAASVGTVRVVVGYTGKARAFMGALPRPVPDQIRDSIDFTNAVFRKQGLATRFEVPANGIIAVAYVERTAADGVETPIMQDKAQLRTRTGTLAPLEALRISARADVVILVEMVQRSAANAIACGESGALEASTPSDAIAIINAPCIDSMVSHSMTHELGHLLGARHDFPSASEAAVPPATHHAYGFVTTLVPSVLTWRDVMSLPSQCGGCIRLPQFSDQRCLARNPAGDCYPSGTNDANAVVFINRNTAKLATVFERSSH